MANKTLSLEEIMQRLAETETLKQQAIEQLLAQREELDSKLASLGYTAGKASKPSGKKRHRRTKEEIAAARAAGEK